VWTSGGLGSLFGGKKKLSGTCTSCFGTAYRLFPPAWRVSKDSPPAEGQVNIELRVPEFAGSRDYQCWRLVMPVDADALPWLDWDKMESAREVLHYGEIAFIGDGLEARPVGGWSVALEASTGAYGIKEGAVLLCRLIFGASPEWCKESRWSEGDRLDTHNPMTMWGVCGAFRVTPAGLQLISDWRPDQCGLLNPADQYTLQAIKDAAALEEGSGNAVLRAVNLRRRIWRRNAQWFEATRVLASGNSDPGKHHEKLAKLHRKLQREVDEWW